MKAANLKTGIRLRIVLQPGVAFGPGKADLLEGIAQTGSIAAAGRRMGMSYKRAWGLVEVLNSYFREPLVESSRGGSRGGGAALTETGRRVLELYRGMEERAVASSRSQVNELRSMLSDISSGT
ncbi:MAG: winged helix-turn-helix domain-containing protein [Flavobacteriaceae bacterium]